MNKVCIIHVLFLLLASCDFPAQESDYSLLSKYGSKQKEELDMKMFQADHSSSVNAYNGSFRFSIPLSQVGDAEVSAALSLDYTSGVKVSDHSGIVGMGWNLSSIGSITREVNGVSDFIQPNESSILGDQDAANNYGLLSNGGMPNLPASISSPDYPNACPLIGWENPGLGWYYDADDLFHPYQRIDTERDIFTLSVPGFQCRFFFQDINTPVFIDPQRFRIISKPQKESFDASLEAQWIIELDNGYRYYFGITRSSVAYFRSSSLRFSVHVLAWNLSRIVTPSGKQIDIAYNSFVKQPVNPTALAHQRKTGASVMQVSPGSMNYNYTLGDNEAYQEICYPVELTFFDQNVKEQRVELEYHTNRQDALFDYPVYLKWVKRYVTAPDSTEHISSSTELNHHLDEARLWLKEVRRFSSSGTAFPKYIFDYHERESFPSIVSFGRDIYNYYNGAENTHLIPGSYSGISVYGEPQINTPADRSIHATWPHAGNLTSIRTPLGAEIQVEYESNALEGGQAPGIRVKRLLQCDPDMGPQCKIQRYVYRDSLNPESASSGKLMRLPKFDQYVGYLDVLTDPGTSVMFPSLMARRMFSASPLNGYSWSAAGKEVGYSRVFILSGENGEYGVKEMNFMNQPDAPTPMVSSSGYYNTTVSAIDIRPINQVPLNTFEFTNGQVVSEVEYRLDSGVLIPVLKKTNTYGVKQTMTSGTILTNLGYIYTPGIGCDHSGATAEFANCLYYSRTFRKPILNETSTIFYDDEGGELKTTQVFSYNFGGKIVSRNTYVNDWPETSVIYSYYPFVNYPEDMQQWPADAYGRVILAGTRTMNRDGEQISGERYSYYENGLMKRESVWNRDLPGPGSYETAREFFYRHADLRKTVDFGSVRASVWQGMHRIADIAGYGDEVCLIDGFDQEAESGAYAGLGYHSFVFTNGEEALGVKHAERDVPYTVSFWSKSTAPVNVSFQYTNQEGNVVHSQGDVGVMSASSAWKYHSFTVPSVSQADAKLTVIFEASNGTTTASMDELRIHPEDAMVETYQYDVLGRLQSKVDTNNRIEKYVYDERDMLKYTYDFEGNIIQKTEQIFKLGTNE